MGRQIQATGFYLSGLLSLVLAVLKMTRRCTWFSWRVLLAIWVFWGHQGLYVAVGAHVAVVDRIWRGERRPQDSWDAPTGRISSSGNVVFARLAG